MAEKINFSIDDINNIINKHTINNIDCRKIGALYNVSEYTIREILKKHNITIINRQFKKKYSVNELFFSDVNSINSFFIGLMASDGNINKNLNSFSISQSGDNGLKLIDTICKWINFNGVTYHNNTTHKIAHNITVTSKKMVKNLIEHNITPNKSSTYSYNNKALFNEFLQGYVEGDGCVGIYKKNGIEYYYISFFGNENFKESIIDLLPIKPTCYRINEKYFEMKFFGRKGIEFSNWLWKNPVYLNSSKYNKFIAYNTNKYVNCRHQIYHNLNSKILRMINEGLTIKEITELLNISKRTIYNLNYNKKNGRNTF